MADNDTAFAQRSRQKLFFEHNDMDYYLAWIVGREIYEGSDRAECLELARQIRDGDPASWQAAWPWLARQVEAGAEQLRQQGQQEEARRAYLRACTYYRAPLFIMGPADPAFAEHRARMQSCFRQAAALFRPAVEPVEVPFRGRLLPGYFWQADGSGQRRPTLIVAGGIETFGEDCYFMVGPEGPRRGYNVLAVDLPGQGINPEQGLYLEARMGTPVSAVVDYALSRPEIDPDRLALFGFSWGGHIALKGAQHDRRIKAVIANPPMPDVFRAALAQQKGHRRGDPVGKLVFQQIAWRMGLKISLKPGDLWRRTLKAYDYLAHGRARPAEIRCPALLLAGEGEAEITLKIARECFQQLPHPQKELRIFTRQEGGEAHCQVNNPALPNGVMFNWLEGVLVS